MSRKPLSLLLITLGLAAIAWWLKPSRPKAENAEMANAPQDAPNEKAVAPAPALAPTPAPADATRIAPDVPATTRPAPREQRAFRFVFADKQLSLEAVDDIRGDFKARRGPLAWEPGMWCCRLLDAQQRVLAEDTLHPPDEICVVLDPNTPGPDGEPQAAQLSPTGPVTFQLRLPKVESATQLKVYRLTGPRPTLADAEPMGQLLAAFPLPR